LKNPINQTGKGKAMSRITNKDRALRIVRIIETIEPYNEDDMDWQQGITDIMTDIMHFCEQMKADPHGNDLDFEKELEMARRHFETEREEEGNALFIHPKKSN
jgi:hypothetical protein